MKMEVVFRVILLTGIQCFGHIPSVAQASDFHAEAVIGHRSFVWQHHLKKKVGTKWNFSNLTLLDADYKGEPNIFFVRNMIGYTLTSHMVLSAAAGLKNPGAFGSAMLQYIVNSGSFNGSFTIGPTAQSKIWLEQAMALHYSPPICATANLHISLFASGSTDFKVLDRGVQQLRLGVSKKQFTTGLAANADQFARTENNLINIGIFIKHQF